MAMSNWFPVVLTLPTAKRWLTLATCTPRPTRELAYTSAKVAEAALKPTVPELAMLLPIMSSDCEAALSPLKPCPKPMSFLVQFCNNKTSVYDCSVHRQHCSFTDTCFSFLY